VTDFSITGICEIDESLILKYWNHLWSISQWKDEFTLVKGIRKNSEKLELKVRIYTNTAKSLIEKLKLTQIKSNVFTSGSTWK
jgi:hypothetical protein